MKLTIRETAIFGMFGALMYASKLVMDAAPNIHLLGTFVITLTLVYKQKALYPIYTFVIITGIFSGFAAWWFSYLYIWTLLWAATMILPPNIPNKIKPLVYMCLCASHGFLYGVLFSPMQALFFGLNLEGTIAWIIAGLPFDFIHGVSNFFCGMLICPFVSILRRADQYSMIE